MAVLFAVNSSFAQPQMKIQVFGGYNIPLAGLGGNSNYPPTAANESTPYWYQKSGFNAGADFKYFLGKKRNLGLVLNAAYNGYNSGTFPTSTPAFSLDGGKLTLNNVRIAVGAEWDFIPKSAKKTFVDPFVGIDLVGNFLSGKFTPSSGTALTMNSASRFGIGVGAGIDIMVKKTWGFVIGAKYDFINLIGKQDNSTQTSDGTNYYLTDKAYTTAGGTSVNALNMMDIQLYGGVTFAFGEPKKMVKK